MKIISLAIQKGGSGKTTTAINLAAAIQQQGYQVLLIDLDPQANLTQALGYEEPEPNLYQLFKEEMEGEEAQLSKAIIKTGELEFIPAALDLANAELELISTYGREKILSLMLETLPKDKYDFVLIDCPPAIGMLTVNALVASDYILMPLQAEFLPLKGVQSFMRTFKKVRKQLKPQLKILGFVLTKFNERTSTHRNILDQLVLEYGEQVFNTKIRNNIALAKAQEWGVDIFQYDPKANGAKDYKQLAEEFLQRLG